MPNKAVGAGMGSAFGGALATLIISLWWKDADPTSGAALATVITTVLAFVGAYLPHRENTNTAE